MQQCVAAPQSTVRRAIRKGRGGTKTNDKASRAPDMLLVQANNAQSYSKLQEGGVVRAAEVIQNSNSSLNSMLTSLQRSFTSSITKLRKILDGTQAQLDELLEIISDSDFGAELSISEKERANFLIEQICQVCFNLCCYSTSCCLPLHTWIAVVSPIMFS